MPQRTASSEAGPSSALTFCFSKSKKTRKTIIKHVNDDLHEDHDELASMVG